jgi:hypothetical protein
MTEPSEFRQQWDRFTSGFDACAKRLFDDVEACWQDCQKVLDSQRDHLMEQPPAQPVGSGLSGYREMRGRLARDQFLEPLDLFKRANVYSRSLLAWHSFEQGLADLVRQLPEQVEAFGPEILSTLEFARIPWHRRLRLRWRRGLVTVPLQGAVVDEISSVVPGWLEEYNRFLLALLTDMRQAGRAWHLNRAVLDHQQAGRPLGPRTITARQRESEGIINQSMHVVAGILMSRDARRDAILRRVARSVTRHAGRKEEAPTDLDWRAISQPWRENWRLLEQATHEFNQLEILLERFEHNLGSRTQDLQDSLQSEFEELQCGINLQLEALAGFGADRRDGVPPPVDLRFVPTGNRLSDFEAAFAAELDTLPDQIPRHDRRLERPARRRPAATLQPRQVAREAFSRDPREQLAEILTRVGGRHAAVVQVLERAREVVKFADVSDDSAADSGIRQEAVQNASALLVHLRQEIEQWKIESDRALPAMLAILFVETRNHLSLRRLGVVASLSEYGLARFLSFAWDRLRRAFGRSLRTLAYAIEKALHFLLRAIGWKVAGEALTAGVSRRPLLPAEFTAESGVADSSALYYRLFQQKPVEDPRFLQGRELELETLQQARETWDRGRPISLLVVGTRGSGKTSLINCILKQSFGDLTVLRAEFNERILTREALHAFLARLAGLDNPDGLEAWLSIGRRVIVLEETERTFLREVGQYEAIRGLMQLVSATSRHTLWILAINWSAFHLLRAAVGLDSVFSHRLRIGVSSPSVLRDAIMARHYYSGLRIEYPPPIQQRRLAHEARRALGRGTDPESVFFETLAVASGGIFRAAIDIWLGQVDQIQAGVLALKPFHLPDLTPVIEDLQPDNLFTLIAIAQHGSLTVDELARVFQLSRPECRARLDELVAREILEPDPAHPGHRIRPEAMRLVYQAVFHRGLV